MNDLKVVFMGTPDFAVNVLTSLIENTSVIGVVCQPDREKDRKGNIIMPKTKEVAIKYHIPFYQPMKIRTDYQEILDLKPDIIITCAYGQIIPKEILDFPRLGCINVHASLLPKYRGGAPIHWSIIKGENETGITIMYMDEKMDEGDIITQAKIKILEDDNLDKVYNNLSILGAKLLIETLPSIISGKIDRIVQDESCASYAYNIKKSDELIDFNKSTRDIYNHIRGLSSVPGAYFMLDNKRVKVYASRYNDHSGLDIGVISHVYEDGIGVTCADGEVVLTDIQIEGKKRMLVKDYLRGIKKEELLGKKVNY